MVRSSYVRKLRFNDVGFWFVIVRYFVLLNNYVTLGLQKHVFLIKSDIRHFFVRSGDVWKVLRCVLVCQFTVSFPTSELCYKCFCFSWRWDYVPLWYVALRMEITYGNYVSFLFVIVTYFLFRHNYAIYLFGVVTIFDEVRITLFSCKFELRIEMTWKLRFVFVRHCDVFFISLQLRYLFVWCSYVFWWR